MGKIATGTDSSPAPIPAQSVTITRRPAAGPDLGAMSDLLWRGAADGFITFAVSKPAGMRELVAVPAKYLHHDEQPWLPYLLERIQRDSYATINPMWRSGIRTRKREVYEPAIIEGQRVEQLTTHTAREYRKPETGGLFHPHRASEDVRWLTAAYVDCDGRKAHPVTDGPGSVANLLRAVRAGLVPVPSWIIASGRGAWGFWQLLDARNPSEGALKIGRRWHYPHTAVAASRLAIDLHHAVNTALAERLRDIGADSVSDAARMIRVWGSLNSAADARVDVLPILSTGGVMQAYTLEELATWLRVPMLRGRPPKAIGIRPPLSEAQQAQRLEAMRSRCRKVYEAIRVLAARRGAFAVGHRNMAILYLALHGHLAGVESEAVEGEARRIAAGSLGYGVDPDFGPMQIKAILRSARRKAARPRVPPRYSTIIAALGISAVEQGAIGLLAKRPGAGQRARQQTRYATIEAILARLGYTPSTYEMARLLAEAGHGVSRVIVAEDYRRLGLTSEGRRGRPRATLPLE